MPVALLKVDAEHTSLRLDVFIAEGLQLSRSQAQRLIRKGSVVVNQKREAQNYRVRPDDCIEVVRGEEPAHVLAPEPIPLTILHRDHCLVVVDKPHGMVVYPGAGHESGTLLNGILFHCGALAGIGGPLRNGVVHRLDKDTSGVMVVALDDAAYYGLVEQFRKRAVTRSYLAIVYGLLKNDSGEILLGIGRSLTDRKKMSTRTRRSKTALTTWRVLRRFAQATLVEAKLGTGRTHQIRVHFAAIGHPVLGDRTYGRKISVEMKDRHLTFPRQMLHAATLGFVHPVTGRAMEFTSPLPADMEEAIERLEGRNENPEFRIQ
ncbi:MAG: RluA family pseudouridine synthase [Chloroflexota bacterium]